MTRKLEQRISDKLSNKPSNPFTYLTTEKKIKSGESHIAIHCSREKLPPETRQKPGGHTDTRVRWDDQNDNFLMRFLDISSWGKYALKTINSVTIFK